MLNHKIVKPRFYAKSKHICSSFGSIRNKFEKENNKTVTTAVSMDDICYRTLVVAAASSTTSLLDEQQKDSPTLLTSSSTQTQQTTKALQENCNNQKHNVSFSCTPTKPKNIAVISPNSHHGNNRSPSMLRKRQQHRHVDISKFNRSNRKSKNCAIFYFKHLDTDNETSYGGCGLSSSASHNSEVSKPEQFGKAP